MVINLPVIANSTQQALEIVVFAAVRACDLIETPQTNGLDIHYYDKEGQLDIVDLTTIQCVVGRVHDRNRWALIDRSGQLARAVWEDNDV